MAINKKLIAERRRIGQQGLSQTKAAKAIGITPRYYAEIENGRIPGCGAARKITRFYDKPVDYFFQKAPHSENESDRKEGDEIFMQEVISNHNRSTDIERNYDGGKELINAINGVLDTLTPREGQVINLYYGLLDGEAKTLKEIGTIFNLTQDRTRKIKEKALARLRRPHRKRTLKKFVA